jgi:hypothetical protein
MTLAKHVRQTSTWKQCVEYKGDLWSSLQFTYGILGSRRICVYIYRFTLHSCYCIAKLKRPESSSREYEFSSVLIYKVFALKESASRMGSKLRKYCSTASDASTLGYPARDRESSTNHMLLIALSRDIRVTCYMVATRLFLDPPKRTILKSLEIILGRRSFFYN